MLEQTPTGKWVRVIDGARWESEPSDDPRVWACRPIERLKISIVREVRGEWTMYCHEIGLGDVPCSDHVHRAVDRGYRRDVAMVRALDLVRARLHAMLAAIGPGGPSDVVHPADRGPRQEGE